MAEFEITASVIPEVDESEADKVREQIGGDIGMGVGGGGGGGETSTDTKKARKKVQDKLSGIQTGIISQVPILRGMLDTLGTVRTLLFGQSSILKGTKKVFSEGMEFASMGVSAPRGIAQAGIGKLQRMLSTEKPAGEQFRERAEGENRVGSESIKLDKRRNELLEDIRFGINKLTAITATSNIGGGTGATGLARKIGVGIARTIGTTLGLTALGGSAILGGREALSRGMAGEEGEKAIKQRRNKEQKSFGKQVGLNILDQLDPTGIAETMSRKFINGVKNVDWSTFGKNFSDSVVTTLTGGLSDLDPFNMADKTVQVVNDLTGFSFPTFDEATRSTIDKLDKDFGIDVPSSLEEFTNLAMGESIIEIDIPDSIGFEGFDTSELSIDIGVTDFFGGIESQIIDIVIDVVEQKLRDFGVNR